MNLLLDTHALIWWLDDDNRLSRKARAAIANSDVQVFVSAVSAWEMSTKVRLGKLRDPTDAVSRLSGIVTEQGMSELPISIEHAVHAGRLGGKHRDPFDRMLIAQSQLEDLAVVTTDPVFATYDVPVVW